MLTAVRVSDGRTVAAYFERKTNGPFRCLECGKDVVLRTSKNRVDHFAHTNPRECAVFQGESELHRRCKMEIFEELQDADGVSNVALESPMGTNRPDVSATIHGVDVAIEVQISALSVETIMRRTINYARKGIHVLWLLQWTPALESRRYTPKQWEKWIHTAYFGRVYYWLRGLKVASYQFEPTLKSVPRKTWFSKDGKRMSGGGYTKRSKRFRTPVRGEVFNLARDFGPTERFWWEGNGIKVPDAKLFMERRQSDAQGGMGRFW